MRLPRDCRITCSSDFRRVREEGSSHRGRLLVLGLLPDEAVAGIKVGFITTRRLGGAVVRTRMRRRMRALVQEFGDGIAPGHYLVVIARQGAVEATHEALRKEWKWLLHRARLLAASPGTEP